MVLHNATMLERNPSTTQRILILEAMDRVVSPTRTFKVIIGMKSSESRITHEPNMDVYIEPHLLRAVNLDVAMTGLGKHWSKNVGDWTVSREVTHIDEFISHDWHTSRRSKFATLCVAYNWVVAMLASVLGGCLSAALEISLTPHARSYFRVEHRSYGVPWLVGCRLASSLTFLLFLVYWQRIRSLFVRPRTVFIDKLCINQSDDELKKQGILSLAGF